ncbi:MAG TPA: trehalose-6-phosphate synthase [Rhodospirillaceae bacterium]|nr:trehalose-6-phosphate synthase [Rhodospirillaceae bacterium]
MILLRFVFPLILVLSTLAVVATPLAESLVSRWFQKDVEMRSELIFQSVEYTITDLWNQGKRIGSYKKLFDNIARDERVLGVGLCSPDGQLITKSAQWPPNISCPVNLLTSEPAHNALKLEKGSVLSSSFQLPVMDAMKPNFVVLHDLSFATQREGQTRYYLIGFLIIVSCVAGFVTLLTARMVMKGWIGKLRLTLSDPHARISKQRLPREFVPLVREVRQMLRDIKPNSFPPENIKVDWTPQALNRLLTDELPDSEVIVVSNREPYIHNLEGGRIKIIRPASGVVTALEPITRACKGTWIAHGSGSADRQTVDGDDHIAVPPDAPEYTLRRVLLTKEEEEGYYYGLANEGLWPLCHIAFVRPTFRESDWQAYKAVNQKFADAVVAEAKTRNPIVLIQDYHFALAPRYIREQLPDATIITFWHIPWPNPEVFSICPWREEILAGLLGSSVLGFHTQFHCQNFMDSVDRFMESNINRDQSIVTALGNATLIKPYPISIAWPPEGLSDVPPADVCRENVRARFGLGKDVRIGVGIERFDYTKGIIDRFLAIREFLTLYPEWCGKVTFIQAAAPTRSSLPAYKAIQEETLAVAESINREFGKGKYVPIILLERHHEPSEVFELFRAADFCTVSSLHDGMNLVAKEFVAAREDEQGVLILSTFAGASKELLEALLVNPYDAAGMAHAIYRALNMTNEEQTDRMRLLREMVRDNNIYFWAAHILMDAARIRKRAKIEEIFIDPAIESPALEYKGAENVFPFNTAAVKKR